MWPRKEGGMYTIHVEQKRVMGLMQTIRKNLRMVGHECGYEQLSNTVERL